MAAEGCIRPETRAHGAARQWGRDRMAAEGRPTWIRVRSCFQCVNGAATGWPRKAGRAATDEVSRPRQWGRDRMAAEGVGHTVVLGYARKRQWGRDRMAAEGWPAMQPTPAPPSVNGAATGWPRKAHALHKCTSSVTGVNGAATGWPRKVGRTRSTQTRATGVNGAATGWPRKVFIEFRDPDGIQRQWGRDRMAAEGRRHHQRAGRSAASMGPRPDGRGRRRVPPRGRDRIPASMGPRPDGRGRIEGDASWGRRTRVNGAATRWPRKGGGGGGVGRGRPCVNGAATGWPRKVMPLDEAALAQTRQWGRDRMAAEGRRGGGRRRCRLTASMGPRPDGRGRSRRAISRSACASRRQWGRDRMAAEGLAPARTVLVAAPASMGPRPDGRGRFVCTVLVQYALVASMGPRPDGRGRADAAEAQLALHRRQWGRDRMAAEGCTGGSTTSRP